MKKEIYEAPEFELLKIKLLEDVLGPSIEGWQSSGAGGDLDEDDDDSYSPDMGGRSSPDF